MLVFLLATGALVVANLLTDHEAQREGLYELQGAYRSGS
jgi:hypothetical protein